MLFDDENLFFLRLVRVDWDEIEIVDIVVFNLFLGADCIFVSTSSWRLFEFCMVVLELEKADPGAVIVDVDGLAPKDDSDRPDPEVALSLNPDVALLGTRVDKIGVFTSKPSNSASY